KKHTRAKRLAEIRHTEQNGHVLPGCHPEAPQGDLTRQPRGTSGPVRADRLAGEPHHVAAHFVTRKADAPAMPWQDPFERVALEQHQRFRLLPPGMPAVIAGCVEALLFAIPREMVAGEQELIAIEEDAVAAGVPGRGDR